MLYPELYRRVAAVREAAEVDEEHLVQTSLVRDVLRGEVDEITVTYRIPTELQQTAAELVEPALFDLLNYSIIEDVVGRFTVFVEAAYETREPVVPDSTRPISPGDFETVTVVYHLRADLTPVMGKVHSKVFVAFEPLEDDPDSRIV